MKKGWPTKTLGEVCQFRGGGTPSKAVESFWRGDIPWVSPKDMKFDVISDSIDHISEEAIERSATSLIPKDSVLMVVRSGILARTVPIAITGRDLTINQDLKALCPNGAIDTRFLYHLLDSKRDVLLSMVSRGATVHRLNTEQIRSLGFILPPLPEQKRIVGILDEAFEGIAIAKANTEKNLHNARALFESHLQSVFTKRGEGWVKKKLGDVFTTVTGNTPPKNNAEFYGDFMPLVKPPELCDAPFDSAADGLSEAGAAVARTLPPKSILVSCIGNLGKIGLNIVPVAFNQQINAILPDENYAIPEFMFYQVLSSAFKEQLNALVSGTTVPIVNKSKFNSVEVVLPPLPKQKAIVVQLDSFRQETQQLESLYQRKGEALDALKKSLLHQAFGGQL